MNGHVFPEVERLKNGLHFRERAILYRNDRGNVIDVSETAGPAIRAEDAARGVAFGDIDSDGAWK